MKVAAKKPAPVAPPPPRPLDRPQVMVRIIWPKVGSHAAAMARIGRGLSLLIEQMKETKEREDSGLGYSSLTSRTTVHHFDVTSNHEVER